MSDIEWTTQLPGHKGITWNPLAGCTKVNTACTHCYAERMAKRLQAMGTRGYDGVVNEHGHWTGKVNLLPDKLDAPLHWKTPRVVFVNSMSDLFHEDVPMDFIAGVFNEMRLATTHKFIVLTKRPRCIDPFLEYVNVWAYKEIHHIAIGCSVHDQKSVDEFIPYLANWPGPRVVSYEPALGPVDLTKHLPTLGWVICGGESGPGARPMNAHWARLVRDQCVEAGVPFFFKQWGAWGQLANLGKSNFRGTTAIVECNGEYTIDNDSPLAWHLHGNDGCTAMALVGKKRAGRVLDGREWNQYPKGW